MKENAGFTRMSPQTAETLAKQGDTDIELYLDDGIRGPTLYRRAGAGLADTDYSRLRNHGVSTVLVPSDDMQRIEQCLEEDFGGLLLDPSIESTAKAEILHHVGRAVSSSLLEDALDSESVTRMIGFVDGVVNGVMEDPSFAPYLMQMAGHHRGTASHMAIVSALGVLLASELYGNDTKTLHDVGVAGLLHDLGKLQIDQSILIKKTPLTPEEMTLIQHHPVDSVRKIGDDPRVSSAVRRMIVEHHERIDGRGYPLGLKGDEILHGSKVLAVVDSFHAITGPRAYREAMTPAEALRVMAMLSGRQFDSEVLRAWTSLLSQHQAEVSAHWAVQGDERGEDELGARHEHRPSGGKTTTPKMRQPRLDCHQKFKVNCVYAERLDLLEKGKGGFESMVNDLSKNGICLHTDHALYRGEVLHIHLEQGGNSMWLEGRVAWCRRNTPERGYRCGIRLESRLPEGRCPGADAA